MIDAKLPCKSPGHDVRGRPRARSAGGGRPRRRPVAARASSRTSCATRSAAARCAPAPRCPRRARSRASWACRAAWSSRPTRSWPPRASWWRGRARRRAWPRSRRTRRARSAAPCRRRRARPAAGALRLPPGGRRPGGVPAAGVAGRAARRDPRGARRRARLWRPLRRAGAAATLASYLGRARGVAAEPGHVVVCTGITQAIALLARALRRAGVRAVAVEDPGFPLHRMVARARGAARGAGPRRRRRAGRRGARRAPGGRRGPA